MAKGILEEINEKLDSVLELLNQKGAAKPSKTAKPEESEDEEDEEEDEAPASAPDKTKRTRSPNKSKGKTLTAAEVKDKLKAVLDKKGRKTALALLEKFDAEKIGDLEESQYAKFAEACDKALGGESEEEDDEDLDL